jgi:hypothetical protein
MREIAALFWLLSFMLAPLHAAEPPPAAAADETETKPTDEPADAEADSEEVPAEPAANESSAADRKPSPQRFIPSEQVRADFDVSFPIDI